MPAAEPQHCGWHLAGGRGDSSHCLSRRPQGLSPSGLSTVAGALHDVRGFFPLFLAQTTGSFVVTGTSPSVFHCS